NVTMRSPGAHRCVTVSLTCLRNGAKADDIQSTQVSNGDENSPFIPSISTSARISREQKTPLRCLR
ncbi:hypothetical protein ABTA44_20475, partial [Acinetobacter baumannii]